MPKKASKARQSSGKGITMTFEFPEFKYPEDRCQGLQDWLKKHHTEVQDAMKTTLLDRIKTDLHYDLGSFGPAKKNTLG